jgi:methylmalonyl-CoA/ethylmalonyl-CoA epimerase
MKIRQVALGCQDIARAQTFYTQLLKQEPTAVFPGPGMLFYDLEGTRLLLQVDGPKSLIYLEVDDVREEVETLRSQGVKIAIEPHIVFPDPQGLFDKPGNEWLAFIEDTEGNKVGLMSREVITS